MKKSPFPVQNAAGEEKQFSERENLVKILKQYFGHSEFREKQLEAIEAVMSGNDCVCLMPTGGGKSMCYQIPALSKTGIVLVVCPLIERMKNQVMALKKKGIAAEYLSSKQKSSIRKKIHEDLDSEKPSLRLLYVTPKLIATPGFMPKLIKLYTRGLLNLIAIDEAHCISNWGHDFSRSYSQLSALRNNLQVVPVLALTATAVPKVEKDVIGSLCLQQPLVLRSSLNRPNIFYEVRNKDHLHDVNADLSNQLSGDVCSIVYCLERTTCDDVSAHLRTHGIYCAAYHAGLNSKLRSSILDDWLSSKIQVVVATNAIGMGIDRKDVRLVCHYNIPKSMESFYQESGRAGRDQICSRSLLYYSLDDCRKMEFILKKRQPSSSSQDNGSSKRSLESFKQMVDYCEGSTCRRMKILKSFGEQASASLCGKSCDACHDRETISEAMRDSCRRNLLNSLKQAEQRLGTLKIELEASATSLEDECYKKYGKVGRTDYYSQVASTVNWLSTSSSMEISNRVGSNTTPNSDTHMQECVPTTSSLPSVIPGEQSQVPIIVIPDEQSQVPTEVKESPLPVQNVAGKEKQFSEKENLVNILKQYFGHSEFRGKQLEVIEAVMSGKDCLCLMPTGGGKSMCYQIPALAKTGIVLVVCPLIALMENQVMALKEKGIAAEYLSSTQMSSIRKKIHEDLDSVKPSLRLLYVTPELIATPGFMPKLIKLYTRGLLNLIAIDEAHCISTWGHDFRRSYSQLSALRNNLPGVPVLALTATAVPKVEKDVIDSLCLQQPLVLRSSLNRPNIFYEVRNKDHLQDVYADLSNRLSGEVCSIVYCLKRKTCEVLYARLLKHGISCAAYHAKLNSKLRSSILDDWLSSKIQVVVATNAFGMGIDRKDVRFVCHYNIPKSMESFYQESGRAGRDQIRSRSLLYYSPDDCRKMEFILKKRQPSSSSQDNGSSKRSLESFKQMVDYCEGSTCRRMKILKSFGEQASASLCGKSCDACQDRETISEAMRDSCRRNLLNSLKQAEQRLGTLKIELEASATSLEDECYKKYGKVGRTDYYSQVANTVNWLSTSSSMEISNRVGSNTTPNSDTHMQECVPTTSSLPSVIPGEQSQVPIIVIPDEQSQVPTEVTKEESCGNLVSETLLNNPEMKTPSHIELPPIPIPIPIPSFAAEFVTGKVKGQSIPSSTSNKRSISRTHKDAEKKMRLQ